MSLSISGNLYEHDINRDECFDVLDHYIKLGWGNVPSDEREAIVAKLGYLPDKPPIGYREMPEGYAQKCSETRMRVVQEQKAAKAEKDRERTRAKVKARMDRLRVVA